MQQAQRNTLRNRSLHPAAAIACCGLLLGSLAWMPQARAQVAVPGKGHGSASMDYQQVLVAQRTDNRGNTQDLGKVTYRTVHLTLDYGFADRWAVSAVLPYGSNRYTGADSGHDPRIFHDPHGQRFIDDGRFRGGWKDWNIGVRYQLFSAPLLVTPYLKYGFPSHDYQFYGESALGLRQTELQLGVAAGGRLPRPWQNVYLVADVSYSRMQKKGVVRVDHSTVGLDLGYFFSPRFSARVGLTHRTSYGGLDFPAALFNADGSLNEDNLFHHDTIRNISFTEVHVGLDYQLNDRYTIYANGGRTAHGENANLIKSAISIGISRSF